MYQLLDSGFIGLIFSCFSEDINKVGRIQVIAFQSSDGKQNQISRPIPLSPVNRSSVIDLESSLSSSENLLARSNSGRGENPEEDTGDSRISAGANKAGYYVTDGKAHPLTFIHHTSTYQASMCKLTEYCLSPAIRVFQDRVREHEIWILKLVDEAKSLEMEVQRGSD
ncbi:hypothetical protein NL676_039801 [Syzygium grande]|nr:hypothetical protein NL676_039801 [Syzygium grande]